MPRRLECPVPQFRHPKRCEQRAHLGLAWCAGIKPNISPFGADQIDPATEGAEAHKSSFFMYLYLTVNVGCLVAFGFLANVATSGPAHLDA